MRQCDCCERIGVKINSIKLFEELKSFFDEQVEQGIFSEIRVKEPYYVWKGFLRRRNGMRINGINVIFVGSYGNLSIRISRQMVMSESFRMGNIQEKK